MAVSSIQDNTPLLDLIKTSNGINKYKSGEEENLSSRTKFISNNSVSQEQKNTLVSENVNEQSSFLLYNYRFERSVPLSKSEKTEKPYNNTKKTSSVEVKDEETGELLDSELIEDESTKNNSGNSFYVTGGNSSQNEKQSKSLKELFQEKINRVYNIGFTKEPGTLVNLLA